MEGKLVSATFRVSLVIFQYEGFSEQLESALPLLTNHVRKMCRNEDNVYEVADDIVQTTILKALRKQDHFRGDAKTSSWLCRIASRVYLDYLREKARKHLEPIEPYPSYDDGSYGATDPEYDLMAMQYLGPIIALLKKLRPEQQKVIRMHLLGYTFREIGEHLKVSTATVKTRYYSGIQSIREEILFA